MTDTVSTQGILTRVTCGVLAGLVLALPVQEHAGELKGLPLLGLGGLGLLSLAAIAAVLLMLGDSLLRDRLPASFSPVLKLAASLVAGTGVIGAVLMLMGTVGLFQPWMVMALVAGTATVTGSPSRLRSLLSGLRAARGELAAVGRPGFPRLLLGASALALAYSCLVALGPTTSWDGPMYHVSLPRYFLAEGGIRLPPDNLHLAFVGSPHMINSIFLSAGIEAGPALTQWMWTGVLLALLVTTLARWASPLAGGLGAILFWAYPALPLVGTSDLVDLSMVTALFVAALYVVDALTEDLPVDGVALGLLVGAAALIKYQAFPYLAGLGLVVVGAMAVGRVRLGPSGAMAAIGLPLVLLAPLLAKNLIHLGDPLFPFLRGGVHPPWLVELVPAVRGSTPPAYGVLGSAREPFSIADWIFRPEALTPESVGGWYGFPPLFLLGALVLGTRHRRRFVLLLIPVLTGAALILLVSPRTNLRYFLPGGPVAILGLSLGLAALSERASSRWRPAIPAVVLVAAVVLAGNWMADVVIPEGRAVVAAGIISREEFLARPANQSTARVEALGVALEELDLSETRPALLLYEGRGDLIDAPVVQDNVFTNWSMLDDALQGGCPGRDSVGALVLSTSTLTYLLERGASSDKLRIDSFSPFAERCLRHVDTVDGYEIYLLDQDNPS